MKIAKYSIDRPVTTLMLYLGIVLLGLISLRQLSVDLMPNISFPRLSVMTQYSGVAPEEIETLVTARLESAVGRIPGLRRVESVSKEGVSFLTLEFAWGSDMDFTMLHTREALDSAKESLPDDASSPTIIPMDPQSKPIIVLALSGEGGLLDLKEFAEELVKPRLEQIEGIASAEITGGIEREIQVEIDPNRLTLYGLSIEEVATRIDSFNKNLQGGTIRKGTFKYAIRVVGEFESVKEIGEIGIKTTKERGVVRLLDIARIRDAIKERQGMTRLDRRDSIGILVHKEAGANTVQTTKLVKTVLDQIRRENPKVNISIVSEQASYIESVVAAVNSEIVQGAILVFLVVLLFLQEFKTPIIINIVIPISIIATFNLMYFCGITLNIMSLGGLALGVGMLDDCADVVSENIFRHRGMGKKLAQAAYDGVSEVGGAVAATALTTVVVFLPIIYVRGIAGPLFKDAALTVSFSLLASMVLALTLLPMLQGRWVKKRAELALPPKMVNPAPAVDFCQAKKTSPGRLSFLLWPWKGLRWLLYKIPQGVIVVLRTILGTLWTGLKTIFEVLAWPINKLLKLAFRGFNAVYHPFVRRYRGWLIWSLGHKRFIGTVTVLFFAVTFIIGYRLPREHMPKIKAVSFEVSLKTPVDYSLDQTSNVVQMLEQHLQSIKSVKKTFSQIGLVGGMTSLSPDVAINASKIFVEVDSPSAWEPALISLRRKLAEFPDVVYSIAGEQSVLADFLTFSSSEINLKVQGLELDRLNAIARELVSRLKTVPGLVDISANSGEGKPEFRIKIRKDALDKYAGLTPGEISSWLVSAVRGRIATQFNEMEKKFDVLVRLGDSSRATLDSILNGVLTHQGSLIPLRELVTVEPARGPQEIRRENQQREILVTANLQGAKLSQVVPAINAAIRRIALPEGYQIAFGGEQEEMSKSFQSLMLALGLAILLTYMIMAAQFESFLHPFLVMLTLPMGAAGAFVSLWVGGQTLNVMAIIGMVVLVGLVVDDAIVEIDFINQLRRGGKTLRDSVVEGCLTRLRAILMASLDTVAGLIPMALGLERGSELLKPLGIVVAGGLLFSTLLTLILIPVVYEAVEARKERRGVGVRAGVIAETAAESVRP
jgi:hydrophobic/amphiphilic exporter-1 (mainly G- bacteria), HAE1 family